MTQTYHSDLASMNAHLTRAREYLRIVLAERNRLEIEVETLQRDLAQSTKAYDDRNEMYEDLLHNCTADMRETLQQVRDQLKAETERNEMSENQLRKERDSLAVKLEDEERYADALHDSLSDMKITLQRVNDELLVERDANTILNAEIHKIHEKHRKESAQLRYDLGAMYLLRDELRAERDSLATERDSLATERDSLATERDHLAADLQKEKTKYKEACAELREEFDAHTQTLMESSQLRSSMKRTVEKYNELRYHQDQDEDEDKDSIS